MKSTLSALRAPISKLEGTLIMSDATIGQHEETWKTKDGRTFNLEGRINIAGEAFCIIKEMACNHPHEFHELWLLQLPMRPQSFS